jgi:hypothetical protein
VRAERIATKADAHSSVVTAIATTTRVSTCAGGRTPAPASGVPDAPAAVVAVSLMPSSTPAELEM